MRVYTVIPVLLLWAQPAWAEEPAPGRTVEVVCKADPEQSYSCYLPQAYDADETWPILYCFSPNARGDAFVQRYREVCEELGWIVVGSMNSRNGPWAPIETAIRALWKDTEERFSLSPRMRYASGFSGGARVSFAVAGMHEAYIAGVIAIGAGLPDRRAPREGLAVFLTCGTADPNKAELDPLFERLKEAGNPVAYENFDGGHVMPSIDLMAKAVRWMDEQAVERRQARFREGVAEATRLAEAGAVLEAWQALVTTLDTYPLVREGRREAESLRRQLERDPAVRRELKAQQELDTAVAWLERNRERVEAYDNPRDQAVRKFQRVIDRYPDTRAAAEAAVHVSRLRDDG
ncbi:MAG: hypothetical protein ACYTG6_05950 [Planctomycetota bacterium]